MTAAPHIDPDDPVGRRYGSRTVIAIVSRTTSGFARLVRTMCDCGHTSEHRLAYIERDPSAVRCPGCARRAVVAENRGRQEAQWRALVGQTIGMRTVIAYEGVDDNYRHRLRMRCGCGREAVIPAAQVHRTRGCQACMSGRPVGAKRREDVGPAPAARSARHEGLLAERARECPAVWRIECADCGDGDRCERCEVQIEAWAELATLIGGATLEECGALMGVSRERVRQIEAAALRKMGTPELRELLADRPDHDDDWMTRGAEA